MKSLTTLLYLRIDSDYELENNTKRDSTKMSEVAAEWKYLSKIIVLIFFTFKNVNKKSKLWNFEADRTKIAEVISYNTKLFYK